MATPPLRIATRGSQLAKWQAHWVANEIQQLGATVELVEIATTGDVQQSGPIASVGQQGVFTKEVQTAVLSGAADLAVHSLKDLPTEQVAGLVIGAIPKREQVADALVTNEADSLASLRPGARIGTGSLRRQAQIKHLRPDVEVVGIRGNVDTRLRKLDDGEFDAIVLAAAGLRRLNWDDRIAELLEPPRMLPAIGQGALAIECRSDDPEFLALLAKLNDDTTHCATEAERAMLAQLHGGCSVPVGGWGRIESGELVLDGLVANLDGTQVLRATARGAVAEAIAIGQRVAEQLLDQGAADVIATARGGA